MITYRVRKSPFIRYFDKTPPGIVCPHFWLLSHANGCPYNCSYCYLNLTFRGKKCEAFTNLDDMCGEIAAWLHHDEASMLNSGELSDSLAIDTAWFARAYELFANQRNHTLLLLTKSTAEALRRYEPTRSICVSFSINADAVSRAFEHGAPLGSERLAAASELASAGWRVRVRLDPMLPVEDWREAYEPICKAIAELRCERVTLGTLRYFPALARRNAGFPRMPGTKDGPDGRIRLPKDLRAEMYSYARGLIGMPVALCKETEEMVSSLGVARECNCVP